MVIKNLKRIAASIIMMATIFAVNPIAAHAEWRQNGTGWWYADGSSWYTGWKQIDGKWYYFDSNGYMAHDRYVDNYYLNSEGYWDTSSEGFSAKYPSNWIKSTSAKGNVVYILDNKGTSLNVHTSSMQGQATKYDVGIAAKEIKSEFGIDNVTISQQTINGRTVDVLDYKFKEDEAYIELQVHQVIFLNNNRVYVFTLGAIGDISSANMDSFNEMLKTITFE